MTSQLKRCFQFTLNTPSLGENFAIGIGRLIDFSMQANSLAVLMASINPAVKRLRHLGVATNSGNFRPYSRPSVRTESCSDINNKNVMLSTGANVGASLVPFFIDAVG